MEFNDTVRQFSKHIAAIKDTILTEEATKMSLIVPLFQILGYDVFNPKEFCPEYTADVGIKKGERVDYAILNDGEPVILIECKTCGEPLENHSSQLYRYFGTTTAKFGILTNGVDYQFYTDLNETNRMDLDPFLVIDMVNIKENGINQLKKFCKANFDSEKIFNSAEELKYNNLINQFLADEFESPSEDFVRFVLDHVYDGKKMQSVIDRFTPLVKRSVSSLINEIVNDKIKAALDETEGQEDEEEPTEVVDSGIVTTEAEIESFYIIRGLLADTIPIEDITHRDTKSYFGILYQDNNRKPICRLNLDTAKKQLLIPDENKNFERIYIDSLNDLYKYKKDLVNVVKRYL